MGVNKLLSSYTYDRKNAILNIGETYQYIDVVQTCFCFYSFHIFWPHNFFNISPISFFSCAYISFLPYFGANAIWYSQRYFECAVLFILFLICQKPPLVVLVMQSPNHYFITRRFLFTKFFLLLVITGGLFSRINTPVMTTS